MKRVDVAIWTDRSATPPTHHAISHPLTTPSPYSFPSSLQLGKLDYKWQFITLAGFHTNGLATAKFAKAYAEDGMLGYVRDVQRVERELGLEILTHQSWSGAELMDTQVNIATGGASSTAALGAGNTEANMRDGGDFERAA